MYFNNNGSRSARAVHYKLISILAIYSEIVGYFPDINICNVHNFVGVQVHNLTNSMTKLQQSQLHFT